MLGPVPLPPSERLPANLSGTTVGRFQIGERLGQGGMGEVYRAEDSMLRRKVAIKRIHPQLSADEQYRARLLKEAERASSLSNQHVAVVHDVVEDRGAMFLVMEYVEGLTLRQRMQSPIPLAEFYSIARQCIEGIAAAHQQGVLHCDIKPENIMIGPRCQVKILDFGLAKQLPMDPDSTRGDADSTTSGSFSGTPAYMAPEVLLEKLPDARADIFSLGVVFYEVLARQHPFRAESFIGTSDRILHAEPPPMGTEIPPGLEHLVLRMLAKEPAERPANADQIMRELVAIEEGSGSSSALSWLRWRRKARQHPLKVYAVGAVMVIALAAGAVGLKRPGWFGVPASPLPGTRQLAVLPFQVSDPEPSARAYGLGLTEALTTRLAELSSSGFPLQVVSPGDIRAQSIRTAEQARMQYGVNLVLEGTMSKSGSVLRVHYTLVNPEDRRVLRAGMVSATANDPFELEDRVVQSVAKSLEVELAQGSGTTVARTHQPEAYDFYLRGRGYLQEYDRPENIDNAIQVFQQALARDPKYALAYAGLGESYRHKYDLTKDAEWMTRGQDACRKAVELGPALPDGRVCLGIIATHTGKYDEAVSEFRQALAVSPSHDQANVELALALERLGRFDEAEAAYKSSVSLRPQYWSPHNRLGRFYLARGRYAEAIERFEQVIALAPDSFRGYSNLGAALLMTGRFADAVPRLERSFAIRPNAAAGNNLGAAYFYMRRYQEASAAYEKAAGLDPKDYAIRGNLAEAYYWSPNQRDRAIQNYRKALAIAQETLATNPKDEQTLHAAALYSAMLGDRKQALEYDRRARQAAGAESRDPEASLHTALIHAQFGDQREMLRALQEGVQRGLTAERIAQSPGFDRFRNDPGMKALLAKTK